MGDFADKKEAALRAGGYYDTPSHRKSPQEMAAEWKARKMNRMESWSRWVAYTSLNPGMDAADWYRIFEEA